MPPRDIALDIPLPLILFAHGAGASSSSGWMTAWAQRLQRWGIVVSFDYPYMAAGRKAPDRLPALMDAHRRALGDAQAKHGDSRAVVLAGKSMGSRVGCHLAVALGAEGHPPAANICFGYPLRAIGSGALRDQVLRQLPAPVLFLQGSRDKLCPLDDLHRVRPAIPARNDLFIVEGGDHSLTVGARELARQGKTQPGWDDAVGSAVGGFLGSLGLRRGDASSHP